MRPASSRYNEWNKKRSLKIWKRELQRKAVRESKHSRGIIGNNYENVGIKTKTFALPNNFSIFNNLNNVTKVFNHIKNTLTSKDFNYTDIYFDMSGSNFVSVDALMYLLVFIKNIRKINKRIRSVRGNLPTNIEAKKIVKESGFLNYLSSMVLSSYSEENVQIQAGKAVDTDIFIKIFDFIHKKLHCHRNNTKELYTIFGEIIGNANEHAYKDETFEVWNKYLIFANYSNYKVQIVILDTGEGIVSTIRKKFIERVFPNDSELLKSALNGEFRSSTRLRYRGNGLPTIKEKCKNGIVKNFMLITNNVIYSSNIDDSGNFVEKYESYNASLDGTLYYFDFCFGGYTTND